MLLTPLYARAATVINNTFTYIDVNQLADHMLSVPGKSSFPTTNPPNSDTYVYVRDSGLTGMYPMATLDFKYTMYDRDPYDVYITFLGCTANGVPVAVNIPQTQKFNLASFNPHPVMPYGATGVAQHAGTVTDTNRKYKTASLTLALQTLADELTKAYGSLLSNGSNAIECKHKLTTADQTIATTTMKGDLRLKWYGGTQTINAGFNPSVINLSTPTGYFTANTKLTIPALAGGSLNISSNLPISIDFGAGPSDMATSITTRFTETGTAQGTVTIRGERVNPGLTTYNLRAESIYQ